MSFYLENQGICQKNLCKQDNLVRWQGIKLIQKEPNLVLYTNNGQLRDKINEKNIVCNSKNKYRIGTPLTKNSKDLYYRNKTLKCFLRT